MEVKDYLGKFADNMKGLYNKILVALNSRTEDP